MTDEARHSSIHVYNSLFYTKLTEEGDEKKGYDMVRKWTKNVDIFEKEFLVIPINFSNHWSLAVVVRPGLCMYSFQDPGEGENQAIDLNAQKSCIMFMDSLGCHNPGNIGKKIRLYLAHEWVSFTLTTFIFS